jgi:hypothetical protein
MLENFGVLYGVEMKGIKFKDDIFSDEEINSMIND